MINERQRALVIERKKQILAKLRIAHENAKVDYALGSKKAILVLANFPLEKAEREAYMINRAEELATYHVLGDCSSYTQVATEMGIVL